MMALSEIMAIEHNNSRKFAAGGQTLATQSEHSSFSIAKLDFLASRCARYLFDPFPREQVFVARINS